MEVSPMGLSEQDVSFIKEELPEPFNTLERYEDFFKSRLQTHIIICSLCIADVEKLLLQVIGEHCNRFFCRIDNTHSLKTPANIVEKIRRSSDAAKKAGKDP